MGSGDLPSIAALFLTFNRITLVSFGGGLTAWAQRIIVEEKAWLSDEEFLSAYALARALPGANQANFAIYVGYRFRGLAGAGAAVLGLTLVPFCIVLALGAFYFGNHSIPAVQDVLRGVTAAAIGLALSMGFKTGEKFKADFIALGFIIVAFGASILLKLPLLVVVAVLAPIAFFMELRRSKRLVAPK